MNEQILKDAGINYEEGVKRFSGMSAIYERLMLKFTDQTEFAALEKAMDEDDLDEAFLHAHSLKGNTGNLSFDVLYKSLLPFVEALRAKDGGKAKELFPEVQENYKIVIEALNKLKNN